MRTLNFRLEVVIVFTLLSIFFVDARNVSNPLIYTKLRYDEYYLQCYKNFQKKNIELEEKKVLKLTEITETNETIEAVYKYYQNDQVDASDITQDYIILEALDRLYKSRIIPASVHNYDSLIDRQRSVDIELISPTRCNQELDYLLKSLEILKKSKSDSTSPALSIELDAFFDSFGSEESGSMLGSVLWAGNWKQCRNREVFELDQKNSSNSIVMNGRYCIASLRSPRWEARIREKVDELEKSKTFFRQPWQPYDYARFFRIQVGFCLPKTCDSSLIDSRRDDLQKLVVHKLNEPFKSYNLTDIFCIPDESSELRQLETSGKIFIWLGILWCSTILIVTAFDLYQLKQGEMRSKLSNESPLGKLRVSISLYRNYKKLIATKSLWQKYRRLAKIQANKSSTQHQRLEERTELKSDDLLFLNAIRVFCIPIVFVGHIGYIIQLLGKQSILSDPAPSKFEFNFLASCPFIVDWFFTITGFVISYSMFVTNAMKSNSLAKWSYIMFHRYWRLAPIYIILFWFSQSVFVHTGSGPAWDYGTSNMTIRAVCRRESWFWPLTLTSNLHPIFEECIMPSWYISNDMQFFLVTPFLLILLKKTPKFGSITIIGLIITSIASLISKFYTDPRAQHLDLLRPRFDMAQRHIYDLGSTYTYPQYRISSYLIGILAGYYVYMVLSGRWTSIMYYDKSKGTAQIRREIKHFIRLIVSIATLTVVSAMMLATWFLESSFQDSFIPYARIISAVVYGSSHGSVSLALAIFFATIMFGQFPKLRLRLSHPIFAIISKFSYSVFVIQVEVIYWVNQSSGRITEVDVYNLYKTWPIVGVITALISLFIVLWIEMPLANIEQEYIRSILLKERSKQSPTQVKTSIQNGDHPKTAETNELMTSNGK